MSKRSIFQPRLLCLIETWSLNCYLYNSNSLNSEDQSNPWLSLKLELHWNLWEPNGRKSANFSYKLNKLRSVRRTDCSEKSWNTLKSVDDSMTWCPRTLPMTLPSWSERRKNWRGKTSCLCVTISVLEMISSVWEWRWQVLNKRWWIWVSTELDEAWWHRMLRGGEYQGHY